MRIIRAFFNLNFIQIIVHNSKVCLASIESVFVAMCTSDDSKMRREFFTLSSSLENTILFKL